MKELNPYQSSEQSQTSKRTSVDARQKKGLGLYDLATLFFVVAALILLLAPAVLNKGVPFRWIVLLGGAPLVLGVFVAGIAFIRKRS